MLALILLLLSFPALAQAVPDGSAYWSCVRLERACNSHDASQWPAGCVPGQHVTGCPGIMSQWLAAHPMTASEPQLSPKAAQACDEQAVANAAGNGAASANAGQGCVW